MDIDILLALQGLREALGPTVESVMLAISNFVFMPWLLLVPLVLYWGFDKAAGRFILISYSLSQVLNALAKFIACVDRPFVRDTRITPGEEALKSASGYSFPSGHTQSAAALFGSAGWHYRARRWFFALMIAFCLVVGFTRLYLGVHTPQDVLCALLFGALAIWMTQLVTGYLARQDAKPERVLIVGTIIGIAVLLFLLFKPYPEDFDYGHLARSPFMGASYYFGMLYGWYLEQRFVDFSCDGSVRDRAIRIAVGLVLTVAIYNLLGLANGFGVEQLAAFLPTFLAAIVGLWCAPAASELIISKLPAKQA